MARDDVSSVETLRRHYQQPREMAVHKERDRLDDYCRRFIALSPFLCMATGAADTGLDCSPRGDAPGFVSVVDDKTLLIPDRPGNNRLDSMQNILSEPEVGLLFLVPGFDETLRVNGTCRIVSGEDVLAPFALRGKPPKTVLEVTVGQVYFHCGKALKRARLWAPEAQNERGDFPSHGRILAEQTQIGTVEEAEDYVAESYKTRLY